MARTPAPSWPATPNVEAAEGVRWRDPESARKAPAGVSPGPETARIRCAGHGSGSRLFGPCGSAPAGSAGGYRSGKSRRGRRRRRPRVKRPATAAGWSSTCCPRPERRWQCQRGSSIRRSTTPANHGVAGCHIDRAPRSSASADAHDRGPAGSSSRHSRSGPSESPARFAIRGQVGRCTSRSRAHGGAGEPSLSAPRPRLSARPAGRVKQPGWTIPRLPGGPVQRPRDAARGRCHETLRASSSVELLPRPTPPTLQGSSLMAPLAFRVPRRATHMPPRTAVHAQLPCSAIPTWELVRPAQCRAPGAPWRGARGAGPGSGDPPADRPPAHSPCPAIGPEEWARDPSGSRARMGGRRGCLTGPFKPSGVTHS
ncbi:hypothetical protein SAMN06893096_103502 [Geodermatophilus pulveris]|uniref:Uncharacterized protein n=1 Tax=Geodermatophilus pulveris TaxID=1564159 RepID=A0A239E2X2_9ACTN|nr:hypothetical protein SAMN06893096_103502 [Geodermatophilus pulveris]